MNFRLFTVKKSALKIAENIHVHPKEPGRTSPFLPKESEPCQFLDQRRLSLPSASYAPERQHSPDLGLDFFSDDIRRTGASGRQQWRHGAGDVHSEPPALESWHRSRVQAPECPSLVPRWWVALPPSCAPHAVCRGHPVLIAVSVRLHLPEKPVSKSSLSTAVSFCGPRRPPFPPPL